jgi:hypothetical protein
MDCVSDNISNSIITNNISPNSIPINTELKVIEKLEDGKYLLSVINRNNINLEKPITLCDYGVKDMDIDDYKFKTKGNLLENITKLYKRIMNPNSNKLKISDASSVSPKLFIRDILTEYTVNNIFKIDTQNKLIHIMNKIMKSLYDQFYKETNIRLYFVYRGGNILKIYKNNFETILPGNARKILKKEFDAYFKNSDIDFYTVIHRHQRFSNEKLLEINRYIRTMCYYGVYIARIFIMNNFNLFDYCRSNTIAINQDFDLLLDKINESKENSEIKDIKESKFIGLGFNRYMYIKPDTGIKIDDILNLSEENKNNEFTKGADDIAVFDNYKKYRKSGRFDINIDTIESSDDIKDDNVDVNINGINYIQENMFLKDFKKDMKNLLSKNKIFDYYITHNNQIFNEEESIDFSLVRLMINYVAVYEKEGKYGLTNCSSELFDLSIGHPRDKMFSVYTEKSIVPYKFKYNENDEKKTDMIYIPDVDTTIVDLIKILFEYKEFPWEDAKYKKRLYRLLVLTFLNEFSKKTVPEMIRLVKSKKMRKYRDEYDTTFETLLYRNEELKNRVPKEYQQEYKEYLESYQEIMNKILNILSKLKSFVEKEKKIKRKDIVRAPTKGSR